MASTSIKKIREEEGRQRMKALVGFEQLLAYLISFRSWIWLPEQVTATTVKTVL